MENKPIKNAIIIACIVVFFALAYLLIKYLKEDNSLGYDEYLKHYDVNEYISTYVTDEDMARIYLNDFIHIMYSNVEVSYNLLDKEYRDAKFGNIDNYKNYVDNLNYSTYNMTSYYKKDADGYIIFGVYDQNGNFFAFKTSGVMQYSVYLDEDTVEIW